MKNKNTQFLFHFGRKSDFYQTHWYPLPNQTATPEPTPTPDVFEESELERVESQSFATDQEARDFLLQNIDEAEARLRDKFGDSLRAWVAPLEIETEAEQQINLQFNSLRRLIAKEFPDTNTALAENKKDLIREISQHLIEAVGGQKLKDSAAATDRTRTQGITTIDKQNTLGVVPKELVPTFHALQPLFKIIDDAGLDWSGADSLGESKTETYLKDELIQLFERNPEFVSLVSNMLSQEKENLKNIVQKWINEKKETDEYATDDRVDIHHADDLVIIIEIYLTGLATQTRLEKEITAQTQRADNAEIEQERAEWFSNILRVGSFEDSREKLFNTFVKPYQGHEEEGNQYLELNFNDAESAQIVNILTTNINDVFSSLRETKDIEESIDTIRNDLQSAQDTVIALLKEQLPKKFQEQKAARQALIDRFGTARIGDKTINDRLTAIDAQFVTLSGDLNEEELISTLSTLNTSIIKVFTQLDAMATVRENAAPAAPTPEGAPTAEPGNPAASPATGEGAEGVEVPAAEADGGEVAPGAEAPEAVAAPDVPVAAPQPAEGASATAPAAAASRSAGVAERTPAAGAITGSTTRIDSFMANWNDKTRSNVLQDNNITSDTEMVVNTQRTALLVRDPEKDFEPKDRIAKGQKVTVLASGEAWHVNSNNFVKVRYDDNGNNKEGWVAFEYLKKPESPAQAPGSEPAAPPIGSPVTPEEPAAPEKPLSPAEAAPAAPPSSPEVAPATSSQQEVPPAKPEPPAAPLEAYINLPIHRADSRDYLDQNTIQDFLNRSYKKKGEQSYQDDRACRKELDRLYEQVIEPLKSTYKPSNQSEKADVALMRLNQTLSMGAFREERGEHPLEKVGEGVRDRTVAPAKEIAQAAFENIIGHTTAETLLHAVHLRPGEAARSFGSGLLGAGKNIVSVPAQLLVNKDPFEEGYPELRQARKKAVQLLQDHLKSTFPGMRGSEWERVKGKKISELKSAAKTDIYNELERMYGNLGTAYKGIAEFNFDDANVQGAKVHQLINVMATWGVSNVLNRQA